MCGFIGISAPKGDVVGELYEALIAVQHRGQDSAEIVSYTTKRVGGGMWLVGDYTSTMMGHPFSGHSVMGYVDGLGADSKEMPGMTITYTRKE